MYEAIKDQQFRAAWKLITEVTFQCTKDYNVWANVVDVSPIHHAWIFGWTQSALLDDLRHRRSASYALGLDITIPAEHATVPKTISSWDEECAPKEWKLLQGSPYE